MHESPSMRGSPPRVHCSATPPLSRWRGILRSGSVENQPCTAHVMRRHSRSPGPSRAATGVTARPWPPGSPSGARASAEEIGHGATGELDYEQLKRELGLEHFQGRSWVGCYRHTLDRPLPNLPTPNRPRPLRGAPGARAHLIRPARGSRAELCTTVVHFSSRQIPVWAESG